MVPVDHRVKMNENEKIDLDLARELKKLWNMKVTVITVVIRALGMVPKDVERRLDGLEIRRKTGAIQITVLLRSTRIRWRALETWGDLMLLRLQKKNPQVKSGVKKKIVRSEIIIFRRIANVSFVKTEMKELITINECNKLAQKK